MKKYKTPMFKPHMLRMASIIATSPLNAGNQDGIENQSIIESNGTTGYDNDEEV